MASDEIVKTIVQVASIGVGWAVVHRLSSKRDRDKARREMIAKAADALGAEIGELLSSAREYHIQQRDIAVEENLKIVLQDLSARTSLLSDVCDDNAELSLCRSGVLAVKKAITGSHFEDEHDGALSASAQQIQVITAEILRAKRYFLQLKHKQFPRK